MPHDRPGEGATSHYRSGIYDVVSVPAVQEDRNRKRPQQNLIKRDGHTEIMAALSSLVSGVGANAHALGTLQAGMGSTVGGDAGGGGDRSKKRRKERVVVYLRTTFLRIIDVDAKDATFTADVFIRASWPAPEFKGASQNDLDALDFDQVWKPGIVVANMVGDPSVYQRGYGGHQPAEGQKHPLLYAKLSLRAKFKDEIQLGHFPVDSQTLNIVVTSARSEAEVIFAEEAIIDDDTASAPLDQSEFTIHPYVDAELVISRRQLFDVYERSSKLNFQCRVTRRPAFYFCSVFLVTFLLTSLMFTSYVLSPTKTEARMLLSLGVLLVGVVHKLVLIKEMPSVPSMSLMGVYHLASMLFLIWQIVQNAIIGLVTSDKGLQYALNCDKYFFVILVFVFITFNLIYIAVIIITYFIGKVMMDKIHRNYQKKLRMRDAGHVNKPSHSKHGSSQGRPRHRGDAGHQRGETTVSSPITGRSSADAPAQRKERSHRPKQKKKVASVDVELDPVYQELENRIYIGSDT